MLMLVSRVLMLRKSRRGGVFGEESYLSENAMRIGEAVKLLAAPFSVQVDFLGNVPENPSTFDPEARNDIWRMTTLYIESLNVNEAEGGSEGVDSWQVRTQFSTDVVLPKEWEWLGTAVRMLIELDRPFLYTRHGLRSAHEWHLIRHLAGQVCEVMNWSRELTYSDFETLWRELGGGVLDE